MNLLKQYNVFSIAIVVIKMCRESAILLHSFLVVFFTGIVIFTYIISYMVISIFNLYTRKKAYIPVGSWEHFRGLG